jgi:hypothetical protein
MSFSQCSTLALRHHIVLFHPSTCFISSRRVLILANAAQIEFSDPFQGGCFETSVVNLCVFQRIQWKLVVVKCLLPVPVVCTAHTKIVRPSNIDCSEDGNSKLLRNIGHIPGDWSLYRHCCENVRSLFRTFVELSPAICYNLENWARGVVTASQAGGLSDYWLLKRTGHTKAEMPDMWTGHCLTSEVKACFQAVGCTLCHKNVIKGSTIGLVSGMFWLWFTKCVFINSVLKCVANQKNCTQAYCKWCPFFDIFMDGPVKFIDDRGGLSQRWL